MSIQNKNQVVPFINVAQAGFSSFIIPLIVVVGAVAVTGGLVVKAHNHQTSKSVNLTSTISSSSKAAGQTNPDAADAKTLSPAASSTPTTTPSTTASPSTTHTTSSKTTPKTTPTTPSGGSHTSPTPAATPLSTLTQIVAGLQVGKSATVAASSITVPGPITDAHARPIVFTLSGKTYFAYTQGQKPNFDTSASQTASTMAIVNGSSVALTQGHLDKSNFLVDEDEALVGYSTGGN